MADAKAQDHFADNVNAALAAQKLNQKQLAELAEVSPANLSKYLNKTQAPTLDVIERIAKALKTTASRLLASPGEQPISPFKVLAFLYQVREALQAYDSELNAFVAGAEKDFSAPEREILSVDNREHEAIWDEKSPRDALIKFILMGIPPEKSGEALDVLKTHFAKTSAILPGRLGKVSGLGDRDVAQSILERFSAAELRAFVDENRARLGGAQEDPETGTPGSG